MSEGDSRSVQYFKERLLRKIKVFALCCEDYETLELSRCLKCHSNMARISGEFLAGGTIPAWPKMATLHSLAIAT